jgi:hypothetical protein
MEVWREGKGRDEKGISNNVPNPERWEKVVVNSERKDKCRCWQEEKGVPDLDMAVTRGL